MNKILFLFLLTIFGVYQKATAQYYGEDKPPNFYMGLGIGIDYGGIGGKLEFLPSPYIGIFAGLGYTLASAGVNGGVTLNVLPYHRVCPFVEGMYGYNAVIKVDYYFLRSTTTYYGATVGGGVDIKVGRRDNKFHLGVYYPIRSSQFHDDYNSIKENSSLNILPITYSAGFNFAL